MLWDTPSNNTLYTTVKRYIDRGVFYPIMKGMYATVPAHQLDPWLLGVAALHGFGYISCESILAQHGLVNQIPQAITLVSRLTRHFDITGHHYSVRQLQDIYLFNPLGVSVVNDVRQASLERAIADQLYFQPYMHFDAVVNWDHIREIQKIIGYPITTRV